MKIKVDSPLNRRLPKGVEIVSFKIGAQAAGTYPKCASTRQKKINTYFSKLTRFRSFRALENHIKNHTPQNALRQFCCASANGYENVKFADIKPNILCWPDGLMGIDAFSQEFDGRYYGGSWEKKEN